MINILMQKKITPTIIRTGKIQYSVKDFARDFKPILEKDIAGVKWIDHNPQIIKRVMCDIFRLLANAPYIKQDMVAAARHYKIPADQIQVYFDKYAAEDEILLTIIDIEYEKLLDQYGKENEDKVISELDKKVSGASKIFLE